MRFSYTGGEQEFVVPAGVASVSVRLVGGSGGAGYNQTAGDQAVGGVAATVVARLAVRPGEVLFIEVGGNGGSAAERSGGAAGFNGGGAGATPANVQGDSAGGGGGGASDIRICSRNPATPRQPASCASKSPLNSRLVVAAGGGGGGGEGFDQDLGGPGGPAGAAGTTGQADLHNDAGGLGGGPGGPSAGGSAGGDSEPDNPAQPGHFGAGGYGGGNVGGGGGGGGGGVYGGGGGGGGQINNLQQYGAGGGGGGGASGTPGGTAGVSGFSPESTAPGASPAVTFTWKLPPPSVRTGSPTAVGQTRATLHGAVNPNGSSINDCYFVLSGASSRTLPCRQQVGGGSSLVAVSAPALGLKRGARYVVKLVARSPEGTGVGAPVTFRTMPRRP